MSETTPFGLDIKSMLLAAFARHEKVLVYYRADSGPQKNLVCRAQTMPNDCSIDLSNVTCPPLGSR